MQKGPSPGRAAPSLQRNAASFPHLLPAQLAKGTGQGTRRCLTPSGTQLDVGFL